MVPPSGRWEPLLQQWLDSLDHINWRSLHQVASRLDRRHFRRYHFRPYRRKERVAPSITKAVGYPTKNKLRQTVPPPFQWMVIWGMITKQKWLPRRERFMDKAGIEARCAWRRLIAHLRLRHSRTIASKHVAQRRWWQLADSRCRSARRHRRFVRLFQHLLLQVARWRFFCSALPLLCTRRRIRRTHRRRMQHRWSHIVARLLRMGRRSQYYRVLEIRLRPNATRLTGRQRATMLRRRRRRDVKLVFAAWVLTYAQKWLIQRNFCFFSFASSSSSPSPRHASDRHRRHRTARSARTAGPACQCRAPRNGLHMLCAPTGTCRSFLGNSAVKLVTSGCLCHGGGHERQAASAGKSVSAEQAFLWQAAAWQGCSLHFPR